MIQELLGCSLFHGNTIFQNMKKKLRCPLKSIIRLPSGQGFKDVMFEIRFSLTFGCRKLFTGEF